MTGTDRPSIQPRALATGCAASALLWLAIVLLVAAVSR